MVTTETVLPGTRSLIRTPSSMANSSKGLMAKTRPSGGECGRGPPRHSGGRPAASGLRQPPQPDLVAGFEAEDLGPDGGQGFLDGQFAVVLGYGLHDGDLAVGGFAGQPGVGGPKDAPTGYIAPLHEEIIDWNIDYDYRYTLVVGSLSEIRDAIYALAPKPAPPAWMPRRAC